MRAIVLCNSIELRLRLEKDIGSTPEKSFQESLVNGGLSGCGIGEGEARTVPHQARFGSGLGEFTGMGLCRCHLFSCRVGPEGSCVCACIKGVQDPFPVHALPCSCVFRPGQDRQMTLSGSADRPDRLEILWTATICTSSRGQEWTGCSQSCHRTLRFRSSTKGRKLTISCVVIGNRGHRIAGTPEGCCD